MPLSDWLLTKKTAFDALTEPLEVAADGDASATASPGKGILTNFVKSVKSRLIVMQVRMRELKGK